MVYDYTENNTLSDTAGTWESLTNRMWSVLPNLSQIPSVQREEDENEQGR